MCLSHLDLSQSISPKKAKNRGFSMEWWTSTSHVSFHVQLAICFYSLQTPQKPRKNPLCKARRFQVVWFNCLTELLGSMAPFPIWMFWRWFIGIHRLQVPQNAIDDHHCPYQKCPFLGWSPHTRKNPPVPSSWVTLPIWTCWFSLARLDYYRGSFLWKP